ncbi:MAG: formyltransferase family protein [Spirochaetota bacterium]
MIHFPLKISVLVSGNGSTLEFLLDAIRNEKLQSGEVRIPGIEICAVFSDRPCLAIEKAGIAGLPVQLFSRKTLGQDALDTLLAAALESCGCDLILLAGYLSVIGPQVLSGRPGKQGRIWNMHPSLLPRYGGMGMYGMHVHRAVLEAGEATSGCTLHQVSAAVDRGAILAQRAVDIRECRTAQEIAEKVQGLEKQLWLEYLQGFVSCQHE